MRLKTYSSIIKATVCTAAVACLSGCFTGVESTPRISSSDVRRNQASQPTREELFLRDLRPTPPALWASEGHTILIDDERISRILTPGTPRPDSLVPRRLSFAGVHPAVGLLGENMSDFTFYDPSDSVHISLRLNVRYSSIDTLTRLDVPFGINLETVARVDSAMRGRRLYIATDRWYNEEGKAVDGLRHIEVLVDSVMPGSSIYPAAVFFTPTDSRRQSQAHMQDGSPRKVFLSVGAVGAMSRSFDKVFNFDNPRKKFPAIEDDVWELIIEGKVRNGMSMDECRLAIGSPTTTMRTPTNSGIIDQWSYADGVFLVFNDGILIRYRL